MWAEDQAAGGAAAAFFELRAGFAGAGAEVGVSSGVASSGAVDAAGAGGVGASASADFAMPSAFASSDVNSL